MPHDANGKLLQKGDRVTMEFEVMDVFEQEDACNVNLAAAKDVGPVNEYRPTLTCNSRLTKLLSLAAWLLALIVPAPRADAGGYCFRPSCYAPAVIVKQPVVQLQEHQYYQILAQLRQPVYAQPAVAQGQPGEDPVDSFFAKIRRNADILSLNGVPKLNPPPGYPPTGEPAPTSPGKDSPPAGPAPSDELAQLRAGMRQLVNAKCVQCHTATGPRLSLDPSIVVDLTRDDMLSQLACVVMAEIVGGTMPKGQDGRATPLPDQDISLVVRWEKAERLSASQQSRQQPQQPVPQQGLQPPPAAVPMAGR